MKQRTVCSYAKHKTVNTGSWDGQQARDSIAKWASSDGSGSKEKMDWGKYSTGFGWYDESQKDNFGAYKLPHHTIMGGEFVTPWGGVTAAMGRLSGTHISPADKRGVYNHLAQHYRKDFDVEPPEMNLVLIGEVPEMLSYSDLFAQDYQEGRGDIVSRGFLPDMSEIVRSAFQTNVADLGVDPASVFVITLHPSTQAVDSYGTRMGKAVLNRYVRDAIDGTPLMNSHRTGGFFKYSELPMGYSFDGSLIAGEELDETPILGRSVVPVSNDDDVTRHGHVLQSLDYMIRDYCPNGPGSTGTNDIIKGVEGRSIRSISIGFGSDVPSRLRYECALCGKDMMRYYFTGNKDDCRHIPFVRDKRSNLIAFAWVRNSRMNEHSTVWKGATPGALVAGARAAVRAGDLAGEPLDFLQSLWQMNLTEDESVSVPQTLLKEVGMTDEIVKRDEEVIVAADTPVVPVATEGAAPPVVREEEVTAPVTNLVAEEPASAPDVEALRATFDAKFSETTGLFTESLERLTQALTAIEARITKIELPTKELVRAEEARIQAENDARLRAESETQALLKTLHDEAVAARVRALGQDCNAEAYRDQLSHMTVDQIRAEIKVYEDSARKVFKPGRLTGGQNPRQTLPPAPVEASQDPTLYQTA